MKILVYGDAHFSEYSSIIRGLGDKYTPRLENLILSINWVEELAEKENCGLIVNLGDFFDKPDLTSREISAFKEIKWSSLIPHIHLCGNHEMGSSNHIHSSCNVFSVIKDHSVISSPCIYEYNNKKIGLLPYILENNRKSLEEYFNKHCDIIFSHNDIKGIQMGNIISQSGFSVDEIQRQCSLFINGHIHNGMIVAPHVINCGNITGQNFNEDASIYEHHALIVDTDILEVLSCENPYAFNFYKLLNGNTSDFSKLKANSVISVECDSTDLENVKTKINSFNVLFSRLLTKESNTHIEHNDIETLSIDHIEEFKKFMLENIGEDDLVREELGEICK